MFHVGNSALLRFQDEKYFTVRSEDHTSVIDDLSKGGIWVEYHELARPNHLAWRTVSNAATCKRTAPKDHLLLR